MKRFATLLTVSVALTAVAFADTPVTEPDFGNDTGFPYHPGEYITSTLDADAVWFECFCGPSDYTEFPASSLQDPYVITSHDVLRMTSTVNGGSYVPATYIQHNSMDNWDGRVLDISFWFAVESSADALGFYVNQNAVTMEPANSMDFDGFAVIITRVSGDIWVSLYNGNTLIASQNTFINDNNFHQLRFRYDDVFNKARVDMFEMFDEVEVIGWTDFDAIGTGWAGFGGFAAQGGRQYIDGICLTITDDHDDHFVDAVDQPMGFALAQNMPNPFNPTTTISFTMPETGLASLNVYDLAGRNVATLVDGMVESGQQSVVFDGSQLSSGVYFYTLEAAGTIDTRKMVLVK